MHTHTHWKEKTNFANCTCNTAAINNNEYIVKRACCLLRFFFLSLVLNYRSLPLVGWAIFSWPMLQLYAVVPIATLLDRLFLSHSHAHTYTPCRHTTHIKSFSSNSACHCVFSLLLLQRNTHSIYYMLRFFNSCMHACMHVCCVSHSVSVCCCDAIIAN